MSKKLDSFYDATKYLGQFVGQQIEFLRKTSCMDVDERKVLAIFKWLEDTQSLDLTQLSDDDLIKKIVEPLIELVGYALWPRDTVTDMALRKANPMEEESFEPDTKENEVDTK